MLVLILTSILVSSFWMKKIEEVFWSYERETVMRRELLEFNSTVKPCFDLIRVLFREKVIGDVAAVIFDLKAKN
ncbi:hypothetical protein HanRHA438_Chr14g0642681 [Helianthus annuus]|nr:hypothetical protein HanRHA438_Chr14g0642681 [Helianthus annuus]